MTEVTTKPGYDLDEMVRMRKAGASYRDIGHRFGMSHEKARRILKSSGLDLPANAHSFNRMKRLEEVNTLTEYLEKHGPVAREHVIETFGYTRQEINTLVQDGAPGYLIMSSGRFAISEETDEAIAKSLQRAWELVQDEVPGVDGLSHMAYDQLRDPERDLSAARIISRQGWVAACKKAGVPSGSRHRPASSYTYQWSDEKIVAAVKKYSEVCVADKTRPTYLGYDRWQRTQADAPSGSLVRLRMSKLGHRTWPEIVTAARST